MKSDINSTYRLNFFKLINHLNTVVVIPDSSSLQSRGFQCSRGNFFKEKNKFNYQQTKLTLFN